MMEAAKAEARDVLEQARVKIEAELKAAEQELEQMGHSVASELAERVLGRPLGGGEATGKSN
jgi:F0F1-type ATP synthase membrane subunit b/b'